MLVNPGLLHIKCCMKKHAKMYNVCKPRVTAYKMLYGEAC